MKTKTINRVARVAGFFGLLTRQCMRCKKLLGFKRGYGATGVSHGCCKKCAVKLYRKPRNHYEEYLDAGVAPGMLEPHDKKMDDRATED